MRYSTLFAVTLCFIIQIPRTSNLGWPSPAENLDSVAGGTAQSRSIAERNLDSLARLHFLNISKLAPPALEKRRRVRRGLQRTCYAVVLSDVGAQDGLGALLSFIKGKSHIEYSISHRPLVPSVPRKANGEKLWDIPEIDDWTFPENPWEK